jgi:hypothetical protein
MVHRLYLYLKQIQLNSRSICKKKVMSISISNQLYNLYQHQKEGILLSWL